MEFSFATGSPVSDLSAVQLGGKHNFPLGFVQWCPDAEVGLGLIRAVFAETFWSQW